MITLRLKKSNPKIFLWNIETGKYIRRFVRFVFQLENFVDFFICFSTLVM